VKTRSYFQRSAIITAIKYHQAAKTRRSGIGISERNVTAQTAKAENRPASKYSVAQLNNDDNRESYGGENQSGERKAKAKERI
jgi:hypothetical protein